MEKIEDKKIDRETALNSFLKIKKNNIVKTLNKNTV